MSAIEFQRIANKYMYMPAEKLKKLQSDHSLPMIEHIVIKILLSSGKESDYKRADWFLDRTIGKVPQMVQQETRDITKEEELKAMAKELREVNKDPE